MTSTDRAALDPVEGASFWQDKITELDLLLATRQAGRHDQLDLTVGHQAVRAALLLLGDSLLSPPNTGRV
jgi:hypothetical protein